MQSWVLVPPSQHRTPSSLLTDLQRTDPCARPFSRLPRASLLAASRHPPDHHGHFALRCPRCWRRPPRRRPSRRHPRRRHHGRKPRAPPPRLPVHHRGEPARQLLTPKTFSVLISDITPTTTPQGAIVSGGLENLAVFGLSSVDSAFTRFTLQPGAHNLAHTHPTASETLFSISGTMDVFFVEANETPRLVQSVLAPESVTVFPEGLIHGERCISDEPCEFISFFNTGDPAVVTVSERFCDLNDEARAAGLFLPQDQVNAICDGLGDNPAPNQPASGTAVTNANAVNTVSGN
eukprot:TRINITY_DN4393_c0_g1_i4.p3 TRINITY_DN4393_c0_g1~~TRINITY_DN4393_c0_g1_i4.p3  ORF type:complete len:292 (+),score=55.51 TRINITY_DN4393_c0_g1_i4:451-1326(+)